MNDLVFDTNAPEGSEILTPSGATMIKVGGVYRMKNGAIAVGDSTSFKDRVKHALEDELLNEKLDQTFSTAVNGQTVVKKNNDWVSGLPKSKAITLSTGVIDLSLGNFFKMTISSARTISLTNEDSENVDAVVLQIVHTAGVITWPSTVRWENNSAPSFTSGKTHFVGLLRNPDSASWFGFPNVNFNN